MMRTVTVICANRKTLEELQAYLSHAGIDARGVVEMNVREMELPARSVVVVFPDEFDTNNIVAEVQQLRQQKPDVLSLIVTRQPSRFSTFSRDDAIAVIPKPAWGWTILDAIRALDR
jgi:hypothetical protein